MGYPFLDCISKKYYFFIFLVCLYIYTIELGEIPDTKMDIRHLQKTYLTIKKKPYLKRIWLCITSSESIFRDIQLKKAYLTYNFVFILERILSSDLKIVVILTLRFEFSKGHYGKFLC